MEPLQVAVSVGTILAWIVTSAIAVALVRAQVNYLITRQDEMREMLIEGLKEAKRERAQLERRLRRVELSLSRTGALRGLPDDDG